MKKEFELLSALQQGLRIDTMTSARFVANLLRQPFEQMQAKGVTAYSPMPWKRRLRFRIVPANVLTVLVCVHTGCARATA